MLPAKATTAKSAAYQIPETLVLRQLLRRKPRFGAGRR